MLRKVICTFAIFSLGLGTLLAEEFMASIRKVEDGKISLVRFKKKGEKGEEATLAVAENCKVLTAKFNKETKKVEAGEPLPDGLKNERFKNIGEKGVFARIITDDDGKKITEIRVFAGKKKDKDK